MSYVFNTDILLNEADREEARREFPHVYFALDNASLRETFAPFDARANLSKTRSRRWGVFAVLLATAALLLAGGEMLYHHLPKYQLRLLAGIGGVAGIVSVVIGVFGIMYRKRKMRWLADRLATERLRQFHFQTFVAGAADILRGARDETARDAFLRKRDIHFDAFRNAFLTRIDDELAHIVHAEDPGDGVIIENGAHDIDPADPALEEYFKAYKRLRFDRQIGYCDLVLRKDDGLWKNAPVRQAQILGGIALACVFGILVLHGLVFLGAVADIHWMKGPLIHVFAIWAAIVALSARTFEEGFQPEREIERMRSYRLSLKKLAAQFEKAEDPQGKIEAMKGLEKLTHEEMVLFLKGNYEAQFVM